MPVCGSFSVCSNYPDCELFPLHYDGSLPPSLPPPRQGKAGKHTSEGGGKSPSPCGAAEVPGIESVSCVSPSVTGVLVLPRRIDSYRMNSRTDKYQKSKSASEEVEVAACLLHILRGTLALHCAVPGIHAVKHLSMGCSGHVLAILLLQI